MLRRLLLVVSIPFILVLTAFRFASADEKQQQPSTYTIPLPPKPDFSPFAWVIGDWAGPTVDLRTGKETSGNVHLTLSYTLDKRFLLIHEDISLPAGKSTPEQNESWMGLLNPAPGGAGFVLRSFSSTGFITQYSVSVTSGELRFDPEGGANPPPGWLFRRVITRLGPGYFRESVDVAPPGGKFFTYYTAKLTKVIEPTPYPPPINPTPGPQLGTFRPVPERLHKSAAAALPLWSVYNDLLISRPEPGRRRRCRARDRQLISSGHLRRG